MIFLMAKKSEILTILMRELAMTKKTYTLSQLVVDVGGWKSYKLFKKTSTVRGKKS